MNILFKMNENTIRAIDIAQQDLTFDIAMNLLEMKNNKDNRTISTVAVTLCLNPSDNIEKQDEYVIYGCIIPTNNANDYSLIVDFLNYIAKQTTKSVFEGIYQQKYLFNLDGVTNNLMQSSVTPLDAPILDKWHDAYIHVQNIIKEYGYYSVNDFCNNSSIDDEIETFDDIYKIFNNEQNKKEENKSNNETNK